MHYIYGSVPFVNLVIVYLLTCMFNGASNSVHVLPVWLLNVHPIIYDDQSNHAVPRTLDISPCISDSVFTTGSANVSM